MAWKYKKTGNKKIVKNNQYEPTEIKKKPDANQHRVFQTIVDKVPEPPEHTAPIEAKKLWLLAILN